MRKLEELVRGLESAPAAGAEESARPLRRARAELERSDAALKSLKRDYACLRLREGLGPDPELVDEAVFRDAVLAVTSSRLTRRETRRPGDGPIAFDAFLALLRADLPLEQLVENEASERRSGVVFESPQEQTSTKNILRRCAAMLASDPYVANILRCAGEAAARFRGCLALFARALEGLRTTYEQKQGKVDRLAFAFDGSRAVVQATDYWENMERACPAECRQLIEHFHGLDTAREELRRLHDELNGELAAFMRCFFPRYVTHKMQQRRVLGRGIRLGGRAARRLCEYVLEQIDRTDFLLPRGGSLEIDVPEIPREFIAFRKMPSYVRHKRQAEGVGLAATGEDS